MKTKQITVKSCEDIPVEKLETTPHGKVICPLCGHSGWGDWWWTRKGRGHRFTLHAKCPYCKRWFAGINHHTFKCPERRYP